MTAIKSIYIPRIDPAFSAEFIANIFNKNGIAELNRIYLEPYKTRLNNVCYNYNRAYIGIKSWQDTEAAYNFIERLRSPSHEARIVYTDDNWWSVDINDKFDKLTSNKRTLTVINNNETYEIIQKLVFIDSDKTKLLRSIVQNFKDKINDAEEDNLDYIEYLREIDLQRGIMV